MKLITILTFIFLSNALNSQVLEKTNNGYSFRSIEYIGDKEILDLLTYSSTSIKSLQAYRKSELCRKRSVTLGFTTIIGLVGTGIFLNEFNKPFGDTPNWGMFYLAFLTGTASLTTGSFAIFNLIKSHDLKNNKVVDLFNSNLPAEDEESSKIELMLKGNSVGLVISF